MNEDTRLFDDTVPTYLLLAAQSVLRDREKELMEIKGPCRTLDCSLHRAHRGPCNIVNKEQ